MLCHCFLGIKKTQEAGASIRVRTSLMKAVFQDISLLPKNVDFLFRSCNVVAFLLEKWLRRKKCRASVCSPVPTNVRRILTRRKLPTRGSTYIRTYHGTTEAAERGSGGDGSGARRAWLRQGCCLIHDGDFFVNLSDPIL